MSEPIVKKVAFRRYVQEVLRNAAYKPCEDDNCIVALVEPLPGCMTQGDSFEDTRELLIDAVETWILSAVKDGDLLPVINGCKLAIGESGEESEAVNA